MRAFMRAYKWEILKVCRRNRRGLMQYLLDLGVTPGVRIGLVDVGWSGTTQLAFEQALKGLVEAKVFGYYLCLKNDDCVAERKKTMQMRALITDESFSDETVARVYQNRVAVEILFSAPHHTVIGYERLPDGQVRTVEDPGRSVSSRDLSGFCREVNQGIEDFAARFRQVYQAARYRPRPVDTISPLVTFVTDLSKDSVAVFSSVHNFDAWASTENRTMVLDDYIAAKASA
jgi:hypothetical protein